MEKEEKDKIKNEENILKDDLNISNDNENTNYEDKLVDETQSEPNDLTQIQENNNGKKHRHYLAIKENGKKRLKLVLIVLGILIVNIIIIFGIICAINRLNNNVYKNTYIFGQDISNYTSDQVVALLEEKAKSIKETFKIDVYQENKDIYDIKAEDIDFNIDIEKTADNVMSFGREDNFLIDNLKILKALIFKKQIIPEYTYSDEKVDSVIKNIDLTIENRYSDDSYNIDEVKNILTITRGKTGKSLDFLQIKSDLINMLEGFNSVNYNIKIVNKKPAEINIEKLYSEVKRQPEDAYINTNAAPPEFVNEKNGYDLDVTKLKEVLNKQENKSEGTAIEFPLVIVEPKVKLSDITYNLYNDKLAGYTTYFDSTQSARANNLSVALRYLNGTIVMPGKTFSYYERIGETTYSKGYKDAATFKAGTVVYEVGGGICQTSSTLYNVALMANLEIVERHQHGLPVGYVAPSRDATVYGNILDFKFKNTRNYPVKIVTTFSESGSMNVSLYGTKEKQEYEVILSSKVLYYIPFTTRYTYDQYVDYGITSVISKGTNGYASEAYITKKLNGKVVSSSVLSKDVYKAQQAVVKVGTKEPVKDNVDIY
ncbi:MAG: hypothetical protein K0R72_936 [Clostridia bacterium]|nr:hypothetical protein [Clostridia bacterium]